MTEAHYEPYAKPNSNLGAIEVLKGAQRFAGGDRASKLPALK